MKFIKIIRFIWELIGLMVFSSLVLISLFEYLFKKKEPDNMILMIVVVLAIQIFTKRINED
jgi:hypothetical protein